MTSFRRQRSRVSNDDELQARRQGRGSGAGFGLHRQYPLFPSQHGLGMSSSLSLFLGLCESGNRLKVKQMCNLFYESRGIFYSQTFLFLVLLYFTCVPKYTQGCKIFSKFHLHPKQKQSQQIALFHLKIYYLKVILNLNYILFLLILSSSFQLFFKLLNNYNYINENLGPLALIPKLRQDRW